MAFKARSKILSSPFKTSIGTSYSTPFNTSVNNLSMPFSATGKPIGSGVIYEVTLGEESLSTTDISVFALNQIKADGSFTSDNLDIVWTAFVPFADIVAPSEILSTVHTGYRSFDEALSPADTLVTQFTAARFFHDTSNIVDSSTFQMLKSESDESLTGDTLERTWTAFLPLADISTVSDLETLNVGKVLADSSDVSDLETLNVSKVLADQVLSTEILSAVLTAYRSFNETLVTGSGINTISTTKVLADFANVDDLIGIPDGSTFQMIKSLTNTSLSTDELSRQFTAFRSFAETSSPSDLLAHLISKPFNDNTSTSDLIEIILFLGIVLTSSASASDAAPLFNINKGVFDSLSPTEALELSFIAFREFADSLTISEQHALSVNKSINDTSTPSETIATVHTGFRILADTTTTSEASILTIDKVLGETLFTSDGINSFAFSKALVSSASAIDLVGIPDGITYQFSSTESDSAIAGDESRILYSGVYSDGTSSSENGDIIKRSYFAADYMEFVETDHSSAYDAMSQQSF